MPPPKTITPMRQWMALATTAEQETLAEKLNTSRQHLYQLAGGFRLASSDRAIDIEHATTQMALANTALPIVYRTDMSAACRRCDFAQKCLGARAIVSEFPIVDTRQLVLDL